MKKGYILIVDDTELNRRILSEIFEGKYELLAAGDGVRAMELVRDFKDEIRLVLLDIYMPQADGFLVLDYMEKNSFMEKIPVIVITGDSSSDIEEKAYGYGVSEVYHKPLCIADIRRRAGILISGYERRQEFQRKVQEQLLEIQNMKDRLQKTKGDEFP